MAQTVDEIAEILNLMKIQNEDNANVLKEQFSQIECKFLKIVTDSDFTEFKCDLADFVQKIIDNSVALNSELGLGKEKIENILTAVEALKFDEDFENLTAKINDLSGRIKILPSKADMVTLEEQLQSFAISMSSLKNAITSSADINNEIIREQFVKLERTFNKVVTETDFNEFKDNFTVFIEKMIEQSKENYTIQSTELKMVSQNVKNIELELTEKSNEYKKHINDATNVIKDYIQEINDISKDCKYSNDNKIIEKLLNLEEIINVNSEDYEKKLTGFQSKLADYINFAEDTSADANNKLKNSLEEVCNIKNELTLIQDIIKNSDNKISGKITEILSCTNDNITDIISNISEISTSIQSGINTSIKENFNTVDDKFENIIAVFTTLKEENKQNTNDLVIDLEEKINGLKQEIDLINTDIKEAFNIKTEEVINNLEPLKLEIDKIVDYQFDKVLIDLKEQIELSYVNMNADLSVGFTQNEEAIVRLEHAYQETLTKITNIEEGLNEKIQNSLELLKLKIENISKNLDFSIDKNNQFATEWKLEVDEIKEKITESGENFSNSLELISSAIDEKIGDYLNDLKAHIGSTLNTDDTMLAIDNLKEELAEKLSSILIEQAKRAEKADIVSTNIENLGDVIKDYVQSACENSLDRINTTIKEIHAMGTMVEDNDEIVGVIETIRKELSEEIALKLSKFISVQAETNQLATNKMSDLFSTFDEKLEKIKLDVNSFIYDAQTKEEKSQILEEIYAIRNSDFALNHEITPEILNIIDQLETKIRTLDAKNPHDEYINRVMDNTKSQLLNELKNIKNETENYLINSQNSLEVLHQKIDMLVMTEDENKDFSETLEALHDKLDIIATDNTTEDIKNTLDEIITSDDKIEEILKALHDKVDTLILTDNSDEFDIQEEIEDIKNLINNQKKYFENPDGNEKLEKITDCIQGLSDKIVKVENEISDFGDETNDNINEQLAGVKSQLAKIVNNTDNTNCSYSLQDVETDIAKLRSTLNEISNSASKDEISKISDNINKIVNSVENLQPTLTQEQIFDLKDDFVKLNDDIVSISARTNKLLLTSDESYQVLSGGLNKFSDVICQLEEKISYIDNTEINDRIEKKLDNLNSLVSKSINSDKVFQQVLMYLGEWVDTTSENITEISAKTDEITKIKENIENISEKTTYIDEINKNITELKAAMPDKTEIFAELESKFENQETRIDRLEMKIERILSAIEEKDDTILSKKIDKIEKQLSKLSVNIEKLASYVDEE